MGVGDLCGRSGGGAEAGVGERWAIEIGGTEVEVGVGIYAGGAEAGVGERPGASGS